MLELISRAAEKERRPLRLRVQVRSFDAMCQMINANLGIGVLPRAACAPILGKRGLRALKIDETWATRKLVVATKSRTPLTPSALLLVEHLQALGRRSPPSAKSESALSAGE